MKKAKIKVRSERQPVIVSHVTGEAIDRSLRDPSISPETMLSLTPEFRCRKSQIDYVKFGFVDDEESDKKERDAKAESVQKITDDYLKHRQMRLALSPYERGRSIHLFSLLFSAQTGQEMPEWLYGVVQGWQRDFFEKNPKRIHPDPSIFRVPLEILSRDYVRTGVLENARLVRSVFGFVERAVGEDIYWSKK